jgi:uncharacterized protein (TIGR00156 family)
MKTKIALALVAVAAIWIPTAGYAQYVGPTTQLQANSIADILKKPVDDQKVTVKGHLLQKVGKERYIFTDGNAEIRIKIDHEIFPAQRIDEKTTVEITGKVEAAFMKSPEIDVDLITVLQ